MNDEELWNRADALFDRLLDLSPDQRKEVLATMPLAEDLRAAVAKLLAAHETGGVLDRTVFENFRTAGPGALSGKELGRWRLEHEIGRGGMAVVYRAHAIDGSAQSAAVKVLTLGAQAGRGNALFRQEQAVLARMRHPHIASLFESGIADDGTPWLAMALVEGVRIDVWCTQNRLPPAAIIALFIDVCEAVAYAHRNLVIHRDLKPSNVMVDQDGHVRLLDFGIARLADQDDGNTATEWRADARLRGTRAVFRCSAVHRDGCVRTGRSAVSPVDRQATIRAFVGLRRENAGTFQSHAGQASLRGQQGRSGCDRYKSHGARPRTAL